MKSFKFTWCVLIFYSISNSLSGQNITGPSTIVPNSPIQLSAGSLPNGAHSFQWSTNCPQVSITNSTAQTSNFSITNAITCCEFTVSFNYAITIQGTVFPQTPLTKKITVFYFLVANNNGTVTSTIFPGESLQVNAVTANSNICNHPSDCNGIGNAWNVTGGSFIGINPPAWSRVVGCPSQGFGNTVLVDMGPNCVPSYPSIALKQLTLTVKLRDPVINGPTLIGCGSAPPAGGLVFSASQSTGAAFYVWTFPGNIFTAIGPLNQSSITLNAFDVGSGNITVQAFASNGSPISSNLVISPVVSVCCISSKTFSDVVNNANSPYKKEADVYINTTNTITAAGAATMHAGNEVRLLPGFNSVAGSTSHFYNEGCSGNFSRPLPHDSSNVVEAITKLIVGDYSTTEYDAATNNNSVSEGNISEPSKPLLTLSDVTNISIFPNPGRGQYTLLLTNNVEMPEAISIIDNCGQKLLNYKNFGSNNLTLNLQSFPDGLYACIIYYKEHVITKKIIKNNE